MLEYAVGVAETIEHAAENMVAMAFAMNEDVGTDFNEIRVVAHPAETPQDVVSRFYAEVERQRAEYLASPAGQKYQQERAELDARVKARFAAPIDTFEVSNPEDWDTFVRVNSDGGYSEAVVRFAARWASLMEQKMAEGQSLGEAAKSQLHEASEDLGGVTGFMYGCAVSSLVRCWTHGEELRRWHNLDCQIGSEGERANESGGVLNPALMVFGEPDDD